MYKFSLFFNTADFICFLFVLGLLFLSVVYIIGCTVHLWFVMNFTFSWLSACVLCFLCTTASVEHHSLFNVTIHRPAWCSMGVTRFISRCSQQGLWWLVNLHWSDLLLLDLFPSITPSTTSLTCVGQMISRWSLCGWESHSSAAVQVHRETTKHKNQASSKTRQPSWNNAGSEGTDEGLWSAVSCCAIRSVGGFECEPWPCVMV